ncbi:MAG: hypothetical protein E2O47_07650, partial [Gemmatimonadetes bacterium]
MAGRAARRAPRRSPGAAPWSSGGAVGHRSSGSHSGRWRLLARSPTARSNRRWSAVNPPPPQPPPRAAQAARDRRFGIELFQDYLSLEAGHSANTVVGYTRDIRRMAEFAESKGATGPGTVTREML